MDRTNGHRSFISDSNVPSSLMQKISVVPETLTELVQGKMTLFHATCLAGASAAVAIIFRAYGRQYLMSKPLVDKQVFETGSTCHLIHSFAFVALPFSKKHQLTGILFASGILLFSGSCYYAGLTGRTKYRWITPLGGAVLILAWASFIV